MIQLGDIDDSGKGRRFSSRFIQPGLVKIEGHGIVLLKKETLDASLFSIVGAPVIIQHKDVTEENADELRCGVIAEAKYNEFDGWYYVSGIIWNEDAIDLINKGWSVSCSYDFLAFNDEGGEENNIHYDKEFTELNFTHLAIVDTPRYERANIVFNCKIDNADDQKGKWVTIKGNHIFIPDGKTLDEVIKEKGWGDKENKESDKPSDESNTTKDTRKHIDRIEKLIKKYNLEPHEEDELLDELGSFEAKLDENLEPREEEALREELFDFEDDIRRHQEMKKYYRTNNSKENDMTLIDKLQELINSVKNNKENDIMVDNEKVDKRKLIDEVAGIMKSAGCDDEDIRTAIGKMEKIGYDDSEKSADNKKVKNEAEDEDKKIDNEDKKDDKKIDNEDEKDKKEAEDLKEDEEKDIENKCKNSIENSKGQDFFNKINAIYNSSKNLEEKSEGYESRQSRLEEGEKYFG